MNMEKYSQHRTLQLSSPLQYVRSVGPKRAEAFSSMGLHTVKDLLGYIPYAYIDRTSIHTLSDILTRLRNEELHDSPTVNAFSDISIKSEYTITAKIISIKERKFGAGGKRAMLIATIRDDSGISADCVFFNMVPYFKTLLTIDALVNVSGIPDYDQKWRKLSFQHPDIMVLDEEEKEEFLKGVILPKYRLTQSLKNAHISLKIMRNIIDVIRHELQEEFPETLPQGILDSYHFMSKHTSLMSLHAPANQTQLSLARERLKYEELLYFQLFLESKRSVVHLSEKGPRFPQKSALARQIHEALPFSLTQDQIQALWDISNDITSGRPMNRLLQGDVGSGKTIIALLTMIQAVDAGYQAVIMAPTEILAEQHARSFATLLKPFNVNIVQLLGGQTTSERKAIVQSIEQGEAQIIIGTHAVFTQQEDGNSGVRYNNLGLIIIDEQHRFGVEQRARIKSMASASLKDTSISPHILVMSATPIPRTLSMTVYGDLDNTIIKQMPKGRKSIKTEIVFESSLDTAFTFIKDEVAKGHQAYIVYPLVEPSEKVAAKSATEHYEFLKNDIFTDYSCALLHGKMHWNEKELIMQEFKKGTYDILIATTVVEVGIDIPNATVILIENAERFGLAQLHQLRGRVGRGEAQSYCFLATKDHFRYQVQKKDGHDIQLERKSAIARLMTMAGTTDGFAIAEADMKLRGPGDYLGTRQSGLPNFQFTDLVNDVQLIQKTKQDARMLIMDDPQLRKKEHVMIKDEFQRLKSTYIQYMNIA
ncbi:MAG: ATP-dependent DNA helicase RecG [Candidatus Kapaibacteriota bacterium]